MEFKILFLNFCYTQSVGRFFVSVYFLITLFIFTPFVFGQATPTPASRFAACDLCGYCPPDKLPSTWEKCRQCLYPNANPTPTIGDTLRITDPSSNSGPTTYPGKAFTGIGCIKTAPSENTKTFLDIIFSITGAIAFLYLLYGAFII